MPPPAAAAGVQTLALGPATEPRSCGRRRLPPLPLHPHVPSPRTPTEAPCKDAPPPPRSFRSRCRRPFSPLPARFSAVWPGPSPHCPAAGLGPHPRRPCRGASSRRVGAWRGRGERAAPPPCEIESGGRGTGGKRRGAACVRVRVRPRRSREGGGAPLPPREARARPSRIGSGWRPGRQPPPLWAGAGGPRRTRIAYMTRIAGSPA